MFEYSSQELAQIDQQLDPLLALAGTQVEKTQQLALDATRLLSCTEGRFREYQSKGFFRRCWYTLSGKTGALKRATLSDLVEMQKISWRYLNLLQERDLMLAHSIITVRNNLLTLAVQEEETQKAITQMANRIHDRIVSLEQQVGKPEVATQIHSWLLTLDTYEYDEWFPPHTRLLRVVRDFHSIKGSDWNLQEIKYLQTAIMKVGLEAKQNVSLDAFVNELIDEIEQISLHQYRSLISLPQNGCGRPIPSEFVFDNVSVPFYTALYRILEDYSGSSATIEVLSDQLKVNPKEALKQVLMTFVNRAGIDTNVTIPLWDLAVELLTCMGLTVALSRLPATGNFEALQKQKLSYKSDCRSDTYFT